MTNTPADLQTFEEAFLSSGSGCRRTCACGREFYNPNGGWSWEEGELEGLEADPKVTALPYSVGCVVFQGREYVVDCDCWYVPARRLIAWFNDHAEQLAEWLTLEKKRKQHEADNSPVVR